MSKLIDSCNCAHAIGGLRRHVDLPSFRARVIAKSSHGNLGLAGGGAIAVRDDVVRHVLGSLSPRSLVVFPHRTTCFAPCSSPWPSLCDK